MHSDVRTLYLLRIVQLECRLRMADALQSFDLSTSQYAVLSILNRRDGLSAAQLSRRFRVTPQSINTLVSSLEERSLISRREAPDNRRILRTTLTRSGRQLLAACDAAIDAIETELFGTLSRAEFSGFRHVLQKLAAYLHDEASIPA